MAHACILSALNSSLAIVNFSVTTSHMSIKSWRPFSRISWTFAPSVIVSLVLLTNSIFPSHIMKLKGKATYRSSGCGYSFSPQTDAGSSNRRTPHRGFCLLESLYSLLWDSSYGTYFFMMMYRRTLPRVWSSPSNWKLAAVSVAPSSWCTNNVSTFYSILCNAGVDVKRDGIHRAGINDVHTQEKPC